jgi:sugar phosphate permease
MSVTDVTKELPSLPKTSAFEAEVYRKVAWRLIPFLALGYIVAYLDRVNVGFAKLQMLSELKFSETVFGAGAGIFFIGYFFFEVPSNLIMHKVGARIWIARIMITWGFISAAQLLVRTPMQFYTVRFLLGVSEAGFFPGIILYLTYWYPAHRRAKMTALFMIAIPGAGAIGGPLSGALMQFTHGYLGWPGWKWMFALEGIPSVLMGIATLLYLDSRIRDAKWLTEEEKVLLETNIAKEASYKKEHSSLLALFSDGRLWLMCWIYFVCVMGQYGLNFWMPTFIKAAGITGLFNIGAVTSIPYCVTIVAMILVGASADRHRERRWHLAVPMLFGGLGLVLSVWAGTHTIAAVACLSMAAAGVLTSAPLFWNLPTAFLSGTAAAAGIATVNAVANLGGFTGPFAIGLLKDLTHSNATGMYVLAALMVLGAITVIKIPERLVSDKGRE